MLVKNRKEDEEKDIRVMNPLALDFHVHVASTKIRTFHHLLLSVKLNLITSFNHSVYKKIV